VTLLGNDLVTHSRGSNASNSRTSIARQRISKHATLTVEAVFCVVRANSLFGSVEQYRSVRPREAHPILNGRNIPFVSHVKYLGVIFDKRITWRLHIEMTEAFRTFIRIYSLFKNGGLSANIKMTLHKALIR
jgi:hypothetical protein